MISVRCAILVLASCALMAGCAPEQPPFAPLEGSGPNGNTLTGRGGTNVFGDAVPTDVDDLWVFDGDLEGNVGDVVVYGGGRIHDGYVLSDYAYVELRDEGISGALMLAFTIQGLDRIEPGTYRFSRSEPALDGTQISAIGCSGSSEDMWIFDRPDEQLDVQVTEGDNVGELQFEIDARLASYMFSSDASRIQARFTVVRPDATTAPAP